MTDDWAKVLCHRLELLTKAIDKLAQVCVEDQRNVMEVICPKCRAKEESSEQ